MRRFVLMALVALAFCAGTSRADVSVQVTETFPPGDSVTLAPNQNFYLRLAYATDHPIQIWAHPYFEGKPAHVGSNTSREYDGAGEALGWFFLFDADARVDEVRIVAGDGTTAGTHEVARYPVQVQGGGTQNDAAKPTWVTQLSALDAQAQRADYERRMNAPPQPGDGAIIGGFIAAFFLLGLGGLIAPAWALWRWRGGWRLAAAVPAALMAFVVLRIFVGTSIDPTSHNLWPFEVLYAGVLSVGAMLVLALARRFWPAARA